jgi:hypothetical protein
MIKDKITMSDAEDLFIDYLDSDADALIMIAGMTFMASEVLKKMDPIAYKESFMCYLNMMAEDFDIEGYNA